MICLCFATKREKRLKLEAFYYLLIKYELCLADKRANSLKAATISRKNSFGTTGGLLLKSEII